MARRKNFNYEKQYKDPRAAGHAPERDLNRQEAMNRYSDYEIKRDEHDQGMYDRVQALPSFLYAGIDPRRRNEMADGGMVREDNNAISNLSPRFINKEYPRAGYYSSPYIQDSVKEDGE